MTPKLSFWLTLAYIIFQHAAALPDCPTFPPPSKITGTEQESACGEENTILVENSFRVANIEQCEAACKATATCKFFTMDRPSGNCGLRSYETSALVNVSLNQRLGTKNSGVLDCDGKVLVGKTVKIEKGGSADCQISCQSDEKCNSWTWNKTSEICVHNYGITARAIFIGSTSNIVSGPKTCQGTKANALFIGPKYSKNPPEILLLPSLERSPCTPPSFPKYFAESYNLRADSKGIDICAGSYTDDSYSSSCFQLPFNSKTWLSSPSIPSLNEARYAASSGYFRDGRWFIAGGYDGDKLVSSIEVRNLDGTWTTSKVELPLPLNRHCIINVDKDKFILTGGYSYGSLASVYLYDEATGWTKKANMATARNAHSCSLIGPNMVMVAGGYTNSGRTGSTEIYSLDQDNWQSGPALPGRTNGAEMITVNDITYHIGGYYSQKKIYRLDKLASTWNWTEVGSPLLEYKYYFGVAAFQLNTEDCNGWN